MSWAYLISVFTSVLAYTSSITYDTTSGSILADQEVVGQVISVNKNCISAQDSDILASKCHSSDLLADVSSVGDGNCERLTIDPTRGDANIGVCFLLENAFWYGGFELQYQRWPIDIEMTLPLQPFRTNDIVPLNASFGNVIERYWLNSKGLGIHVEESVSLYAGFSGAKGHGNRSLCLITRNHVSFAEQPENSLQMNVRVCKKENILETHRLMTEKFFAKPQGQPDVRMIKSPIWSTWARYKVDIDQGKVLEYASEIVDHGFSNSQIEIDDMFSTYYGEFDFNSTKFPDPKGMIADLNGLGFRVSVWVTPFANLDSPAFLEGLEHEYWLKDIRGETPALVKWWQGIGAILDVENEAAVTWYLRRLENMRQAYGIDSFKFDAGEINFIPAIHQYSATWNDQTEYTTKYVAAVSKMGSMVEVRCGYRTQKYPIFVRMGDKETRWGFNNGLRTLIPTILTLGILGYPYILPDMIGGNGYVYEEEIENPFVQTQLPAKELYIRWLQITAYMPAMQFSFVPWQYDNEVVEIAKKFVKIHEDEVTPLVLEAAKQAQAEGSPIIRPLWWIAPDDRDALECETQFLVGDSLLVAPVVEEGARHRDIYLPPGLWEDALRGGVLNGGAWLQKYRVGLDEVALFKLVESDAEKGIDSPKKSKTEL